MTLTEKRLTVAVVTLSCTVVAALAALSAPDWAYRQHQGIVMIPPDSIIKPMKVSVWADYVFGAGCLSFAIALGFFYGQGSWRKHAATLGFGFVWGTLSWVAGVFPVLAGLWAAVTFLYFQDWFGERTSVFSDENPTSANEIQPPAMKVTTQVLENSMHLVLGSAVSVGLYYGFMNSFWLVVLVGPMVMFATITTANLFYNIAKYQTGRKSGSSAEPPAVTSDTH